MELLKRYWIVVAVAVVAGWWFMRRRATSHAAGANETAAGQPMFAPAGVQKITTEQVATQGTQILGSRQTPAMWDVIGRSRGAPVEAMVMSPRTLADKAATVASAASMAQTMNAAPKPLAIAGAVTGAGTSIRPVAASAINLGASISRPVAFSAGAGLRA